MHRLPLWARPVATSVMAIACLTSALPAQQGGDRTPRGDSLRQAQRLDIDAKHAEARAIFQKLIDNAPDQVRWLILDSGGIDDIDYSAGLAIAGLLDYLDAHQITFAMARIDPSLVDTLRAYELLDRIRQDHLFETLAEAVDAFRGDTAVTR